MRYDQDAAKVDCRSYIVHREATLAELQEAEVIYRTSDGSEQAWMVEVDFSSTPSSYSLIWWKCFELGGKCRRLQHPKRGHLESSRSRLDG